MGATRNNAHYDIPPGISGICYLFGVHGIVIHDSLGYQGCDGVMPIIGLKAIKLVVEPLDLFFFFFVQILLEIRVKKA